jgi:glyceraldehyde 3-phosphate dehydrogenase
MVYKVGINGFGRIGRQVFKVVSEGGFGDLFEIVAVNDLTANETLANLLKHDSTYGLYDADIKASAEGITVNGKFVKVLEEKDPADLPWGDLGVDLVIESTGRFTEADKARGHIEAGARKVVISAPPRGRTSRSCWALTKKPTIQRAITSSPMPRAPPIAWHPWSRLCSTTSASSPA